MNKEAKIMRDIFMAREDHNSRCSSGATGVGMNKHDIERLQWEEGDEVAGLTVTAIEIQPDYIRILCDGQHDASLEETKDEANTKEKSVPKVGELIAA